MTNKQKQEIYLKNGSFYCFNIQIAHSKNEEILTSKQFVDFVFITFLFDAFGFCYTRNVKLSDLQKSIG